MTELKPCPFCGSSAKLWVPEPGYGLPFVGCTHCSCEIGARAKTEPEAITVWNTRAAPRPAGEVGELVERIAWVSGEYDTASYAWQNDRSCSDADDALFAEERDAVKVVCDQAAAHLTALSAEVERLRGYAAHDANCPVNNWSPLSRCNCGLSEALGPTP